MAPNPYQSPEGPATPNARTATQRRAYLRELLSLVICGFMACSLLEYLGFVRLVLLTIAELVASLIGSFALKRAGAILAPMVAGALISTLHFRHFDNLPCALLGLGIGLLFLSSGERCREHLWTWLTGDYDAVDGITSRELSEPGDD